MPAFLVTLTLAAPSNEYRAPHFTRHLRRPAWPGQAGPGRIGHRLMPFLCRADEEASARDKEHFEAILHHFGCILPG